MVPHSLGTVRELKILVAWKTHASLDVPKTPPKLILLLGAMPLKVMLNKPKLTENRGIFFDYEKFTCKAMATYHPRNVLRDPNLYDILKSIYRRREILSAIIRLSRRSFTRS
jgi:uracil-DNA glycosylase